MENNFDKYFKDNLDKREFEMKPHFWDEAEALIDAQEKNKWWRGIWFWFGMVLLFGSVAFYSLNKMSGNDSMIISENEKLTGENATLKNSKTQTPAIISNDEKNNELEKNEINLQNTEVDFSKNDFDKNKNKNLEIVKSNSSDQKTKLKNQKSDSNFSQKKSKTPNTDYSFSKSLPPNSTKNDETSFSNNLENQNLPPLIPSNEDSEKTTSEGKTDSENTSQIPGEGNSKTETKEEKPILKPIAANLDFLPMLSLFLENKTQTTDIKTETICHPYSRSRKGNKEFGLTGGAVGYPLIENSSETPFIGFKGGVTAHYFITDKVAIGAELLYHYRSGNFVATKQFEASNYSFGRSIQIEKMTPKNLHYLELPIFLKHRVKKVSFEFGVSANYLLGVRGDVENSEGKISGLIPENGFKKYHANVLLGVHFHLTDKTLFGIRANYTPGGILDENAVLPNGDALQEAGPLYLTFKATQYF